MYSCTVDPSFVPPSFFWLACWHTEQNSAGAGTKPGKYFLLDHQKRLIHLIKPVMHAQEYAKYQWRSYKEFFPQTFLSAVEFMAVRKCARRAY